MDRPPERYGSYTVYEQLGQGGMATVHRAELAERGGTFKQVALKRLVPTMQRELVQMFLDEARLHKDLHHLNIAETYDSGRVFGTYFIAMEYVPGHTLKQLVAHCASTVGMVPQPIMLNIATQLCDALEYAHARGIVHRDVSPSNIMLSTHGIVKLIDFGLARPPNPNEQTEQGMIKGKYGYIAPEYLQGILDPRADLWAVGIIMYELLTARPLFEGHDAFETMMRIKQLPIPRPSLANPRVRPELDGLVMRALERDVDRRWQSAVEMRDAIRGVIAQPGNSIDNEEMLDWIDWVFLQQPGVRIDAPHEADAEATVMDPIGLFPPLDADDEPARAPTPAPVYEPEVPLSELSPLPPQPPLSRESKIWLACAAALVLLFLFSLIYRILH